MKRLKLKVVLFIILNFFSLSSAYSDSVILGYSKNNREFAEDVKQIIEDKGFNISELIQISKENIEKACSAKTKIVLLDNNSFSLLKEYCPLKFKNKTALGAFLYFNKATLNSHSLNKYPYVFYTTNGIGEDVLLATYNGYTEIGVIYSSDIELEQSYKIIKEAKIAKDFNITPIKVETPKDFIKATGVLSNKTQVIITGYNPAVFTEDAYSVAMKVSLKTLVPILGGQHQGVISYGVAAGSYYTFDDIFKDIETWLKKDILPNQKSKLISNKKIESFLGVDFILPN